MKRWHQVGSVTVLCALVASSTAIARESQPSPAEGQTPNAAPATVNQAPSAAPVTVNQAPNAAPATVNQSPNAAPATVNQSPTAAPATVNQTPSKKAQYLLDKGQSTPLTKAERARRASQLNKRIGKKPTAPVNIYNKWTHEMLAFDAGDIEAPRQEVANHFLRCHFTNAPADMDARLLPVLLQAAKRFKVKRVDVVSGFRDPKYNLSLRKKGRQVARSSEHTLGHAIDFRLPGVGIQALHAWARTLRLGGVGFYNRSRFIHVDVGKVRYWNGT